MEDLKAIPNPRSITIDNITPEANKYVDYLKDKYKSRLIKFPKINTTWGLLRFLRARDFNIKKTEKMLQDALTFFEGLNLE